MTALPKIAAELRKLAEAASQDDYRVDPFDLNTLARRIEAQIEMQDEGIAE